MGKIFVTSDLHLKHSKPFLYEPRGFSSIEEHDETIIKNINEAVKEDDILYILGDIVLSDTEGGIEEFKKIKCQNIYIALGNHDSLVREELYKGLSNIKDVQLAYRIKYKKWSFLLSHYPTLVQNKNDHKKIWSIHGHDHDTKHFHDYAPHCYSCCLDSTDLKPKKLEDIKKDIQDFCNLSGQA